MKRPNSYSFLRHPKGILAFAFGVSASVLAACSSDLGEKFSRDPVEAGAFSKLQEGTYTGLLAKYVDSDKQIRYQSWRASAQDISALKSILSAIAKADTRAMSPNEKKSFYINAYNAMTIDLILSHFDETLGGSGSPYQGERSIRNIGNHDARVWDVFTWKVGGQTLSLNDVEHKILRPMGDARIHFAIVCASKGCPPILNRSFAADDLDQTLDQLADEFVNTGRNTKFNAARNEIKTSHILNWFAEDFVKHFGSVNSFFAKYVRVLPADQVQGMRVRFEPYDWLLNESQTPVNEPVENPNQPGSGSETPPPPGSGSETPPCDTPPGSGTETPCPPPPGSGTESK